MKRIGCLVSVLILAAAIAGCSGGGGDGSSSGSPGLTNVNIRIGSGQPASSPSEENRAAPQAIPPYIESIRFDISGPGMSPMGKVVPIAGQTSITETFFVPDGPDRVFRIGSLDSVGREWHSASRTVDLEGAPVSLDMMMAPVSPPPTCTDADLDGYAMEGGGCGPADCNDNDNTVHQIALFYRDADGDGYGNLNDPQQACGPPAGYVADNRDCDDTDPAVHPGQTEAGFCTDSKDNDCDGNVDGADSDCAGPVCEDNDGDGYNVGTGDCGPIDCNDTNPAIHPGATEVCNSIDDNCNGTVDEGVKLTFYQDADGDGYGNPNSSAQACSAPAGYVADNTDCDDTNSNVHPGATETCNGIDENCNGSVDEGACPEPTLTVIKTGSGSGFVGSTPSGISCGIDCSETYPYGTVVNLTPDPGSCSVFSAWTGNSDCTDGTVTMDTDKTCTATFNLRQSTSSITVTYPNGGELFTGGGIIEGHISWDSVGLDPAGFVTIWLYKGGTSYQLIADNELNDGWYNWYDTSIPDGTDYQVRIISKEDPCVSDMSDNYFSIGEYFTLTVQRTGNGFGSPSIIPHSGICNDICADSIACYPTYTWECFSGSYVQINAYMADNSVFNSWGGDYDDYQNDPPVSWVTMNSDKNITLDIRLISQTSNSITVISPNGGEVFNYPIDYQQTISWSSTGLSPSGTVIIRLRKGGNPLSWNIINNTTNDGSFTWCPYCGADPDYGNDHQVEIISNEDPNVSDMSNGFFTYTYTIL